jgi:uncharacterized membrane protein YphA (DoxX/SURF4 family)
MAHHFKTPTPRQTFWVGMILEAIGCALILLNWHPAIGALCLIIFIVLATFLLLRFWDMDDPMRRMGMQNGFLSNIAVLDGFFCCCKTSRDGGLQHDRSRALTPIRSTPSTELGPPHVRRS